MAQDLQDQLAKRMAILRNLEHLLPNAIQVRRLCHLDGGVQKSSELLQIRRCSGFNRCSIPERSVPGLLL